MKRSGGPADVALTGDLDVRRMRPRDLDGVLAIERVVYPRPWTVDLFREELAKADRSYLVATTPGGRLVLPGRGVVVGYGGIQLIAGEAHVVTVASHPAWRRVGVGARLILELLGAAAGMGADAVTLEVRDSNIPARNLYGWFGFEDRGVRPGYYADNREDARILWLEGLRTEAVRDSLAARAAERSLPVPSAFRFGL